MDILSIVNMAANVDGRDECYCSEEGCTIRIIGQTCKEGNGEHLFSQPKSVCIDPETKEGDFTKFEFHIVFSQML